MVDTHSDQFGPNDASKETQFSGSTGRFRRVGCRWKWVGCTGPLPESGAALRTTRERENAQGIDLRATTHHSTGCRDSTVARNPHEGSGHDDRRLSDSG